MTTDSQDAERPFAASTAARRKRRGRGINYVPIILGVGVLSLGGIGGFLALAPHTPAMQGALDSWHGATPGLGDAQSCADAGNLSCAEADYRAYLIKYPKDAQIHLILANTLARDGLHKEAVYYFKHAVDLGEDTYDVYAGYATSLDRIGQLDEAIKMNQAALKIAPSLVDVRGALADQLVRKGRGKEALTLLESFDQSLEDAGQPPYFDAKISALKHSLGMAPMPQVAAAAAPDDAAKPGEHDIPVQAIGGNVFVPVMVDNTVSLRFAIDSGASLVSVPSDVARTLIKAGQLTRSDYIGGHLTELADGSIVPVQGFMLHSIRVGDREIHNVPAMISNPHSPLLLGQSFLRRFKSWSIDNRRRVLVLQD